MFKLYEWLAYSSEKDFGHMTQSPGTMPNLGLFTYCQYHAEEPNGKQRSTGVALCSCDWREAAHGTPSEGPVG